MTLQVASVYQVCAVSVVRNVSMVMVLSTSVDGNVESGRVTVLRGFIFLLTSALFLFEFSLSSSL